MGTDYGHVAYDAYRESVGDQALPDWYQLDMKTRDAWTAAAEAVREHP